MRRSLWRSSTVLPVALAATLLLILAATLTADAPHRGTHWLHDHQWGPIALATAVARQLGIHRAELELLVHLMLFALLGALIFAALRSGVLARRALPRAAAVLFTIAIAAVLGAATEGAQILVAGRSASVVDWSVDIVGALTGIVALESVAWSAKGLSALVRER